MRERNIRKNENYVMNVVLTAVLIFAVVITALEQGDFRRQEYVMTESATATPQVSAEGAILCDCKTGKILYSKNADRKLYPASTTKIMTALVTFEILEELELGMDSIIEVPKAAVGVEGSSIYLKEGERITIEELLYGLMLRSGNDSAEALAECMCGSRELFVERMNKEAIKLGCSGTHFVNPSGLYDDEHYTTAADLSRIAVAAMAILEFREIVKTKTWRSKVSGREFVNKNKTVFSYDGGDGIKIGYTKNSGRTLAASATKGDVQLIAVVLRASDWFEDAYSLLDYGFSLYE